MSNNPNERAFKPLTIAIMTVSDTRTEANDKSGDALVKLLTGAGHKLAGKRIIPDDIYQIRAAASQWIAADAVNAVITTGGTGITGRDSTPEAIKVLLDKEIKVLVRFPCVSFDEIGTSTIQSRRGRSGKRDFYLLPARLHRRLSNRWEKIISHQLDYRTRPCNLVELMPRVLE